MAYQEAYNSCYMCRMLNQPISPGSLVDVCETGNVRGGAECAHQWSTGWHVGHPPGALPSAVGPAVPAGPAALLQEQGHPQHHLLGV